MHRCLGPDLFCCCSPKFFGAGSSPRLYLIAEPSLEEKGLVVNLSVRRFSPTNFRSAITASGPGCRTNDGWKPITQKLDRWLAADVKTSTSPKRDNQQIPSLKSFLSTAMPLDVAADHIRQFGSVPIAVTFTNNDDANRSGEPDTVQPAFSAAFDADDQVKRHAACDECRTLVMVTSFSLSNEV